MKNYDFIPRQAAKFNFLAGSIVQRPISETQS